MSERLKVGVVGAGIGASHIDAYAKLPDMYEVAVLCDLNEERAGEVAAKYGIPSVISSFDALLERDLDLIDVCTPSGLHYAQTVAALEAGHNVITEKPLASSLREVDAVKTAQAKAGTIVCPIFQYRFGHGIQKLHHLIAKGVAGVPSVATAETHWLRGPAYYAAAAWRGTYDGELGGCLTSHAIHIHDLVCEVLGPIENVHVRASRRLNGNETEDMAAMSLGFASGAFATSSVTLGSRQQISRLRFCFENLTAESGLAPYDPGHEPWTFPDDDPDAARKVAEALEDFEPLPERFVGQFFRLYHAMTDDAPLPVTLDDSRRSIELLTASYYSALTGEPVSLPLASDHPFYDGWLPTMKKEFANG